jgi:hypothetical protein
MFTESLIDTELFWLSFGNLITYTVTATVIIIEVSFATWLLLKWLHGNVNINWSPTVNIGESARRRSDSSIETFEEKVKKDMGPIEVDVKKNVIMDTKSDESSVKLDEKIKGKVKTQKDKLKKLRG